MVVVWRVSKPLRPWPTIGCARGAVRVLRPKQMTTRRRRVASSTGTTSTSSATFSDFLATCLYRMPRRCPRIIRRTKMVLPLAPRSS